MSGAEPNLIVSNGYHVGMFGLGKKKILQQLSEKRITQAVRKTLRAQYEPKHMKVVVSCHAVLSDKQWRGKCCIHGQFYVWTIGK